MGIDEVEGKAVRSRLKDILILQPISLKNREPMKHTVKETAKQTRQTEQTKQEDSINRAVREGKGERERETDRAEGEIDGTNGQENK